jgi:hypothetical protein
MLVVENLLKDELETLAPKEDAMLRKTRCLLALAWLSGAVQAGMSLADGPPFIGHFPQGTVELIGVTGYPPTRQSRWWQPDGSAVPPGPFLPQSTDGSRAPTAKRSSQRDVDKESAHVAKGLSRPDIDARSLTFLVRFENLPLDASWPAWRGYASLPSNVVWKGGSAPVVDHYGKTVPNCKTFSVSLGASAQTADFRVGVAMGTWETVITQPARSAGRKSFGRDDRQRTVTFKKATPGKSARTTQVELTHDVPYSEWNLQLAAVADDGSEKACLIGSSGPLEGRKNAVAVFHDLPLSSIQEFRFQVRPYHWVQFVNVSLRPGQATDVKVVSSGDSAQ